MITVDERRDVGGAFQVAIVAALLAHADLSALIGDKVYDRVPPGTGFPYVTIPDAQLIDDGADGLLADEVFLDVHVWSRVYGTMEAKDVAGAVKRALDGVELDLGQHHAFVELSYAGQRNAGSDDPLTSHFVVSFKGLTETLDD